MIEGIKMYVASVLPFYKGLTLLIREVGHYRKRVPVYNNCL